MKRLLGLSAAALLEVSSMEAGAEPSARNTTASREDQRIREHCRVVGKRFGDRTRQVLDSTGLLAKAAVEAGDIQWHAEQQCLGKNGLEPKKPKTEKLYGSRWDGVF